MNLSRSVFVRLLFDDLYPFWVSNLNFRVSVASLPVVHFSLALDFSVIFYSHSASNKSASPLSVLEQPGLPCQHLGPENVFSGPNLTLAATPTAAIPQGATEPFWKQGWVALSHPALNDICYQTVAEQVCQSIIWHIDLNCYRNSWAHSSNYICLKKNKAVKLPVEHRSYLICCDHH